MKTGEVNQLRILRFASSGAYLGDEQDNDVLLPGKYLTDDMDIDDMIDVYVYRDSEDRIVSTTERPYIELNGFAYLRVKEVTFFGAFVDWGLEKDLMIPFKEQNKKLEENEQHLVCLLLDDATDRLFGSTKINRYLKKCEEEYDPEEPVDLLIGDRTDLGVKVIVDNQYGGLIFKNDISKPVRKGQSIKGYVSNVRPDGKLDVRLDPTGFQKVSGATERLLKILQSKKQLYVHDKSSPDDIREAVGMSKKTFKQAVGALYKQRLITLEENGIRLIEND